jgi:hypothetical protein
MKDELQLLTYKKLPTNPYYAVADHQESSFILIR